MTIRRAATTRKGGDNIDLVGWLGYPMQLKINFLCRDSILVAPLVLDVALFLDLAKRAGMHGIQEWLSAEIPARRAPEFRRRRNLSAADVRWSISKQVGPSRAK